MRMKKKYFTVMFALTYFAIAPRSVFASTSDCVEINSKNSSGSAIAWISKPGHYCLTENLHARTDFADHSAQPSLIIITVGDVTLDLQGHTLGRGIFFENPGGNGIDIFENVQNVTIKNGTLQDFHYGIDRGVAVYGGATKKRIEPTYDAKTDTYRFEPDNIVIQNIKFKNNKTDMFVEEKN